ncbi:MAG: DUF1801 domain-containing protein [Cyclobacteriaceae bacterium]
MNKLQIKSDPRVQKVFDTYPEAMQGRLQALRRLIIEAAEEAQDVSVMEETLKWGEPSYLTKQGSTIRIDWKEKNPEQYAIYFKCTSKLVPSFKEVFGSLFNYENNRAIIFGIDERIPAAELKKCITAALLYHKVKHMPELGIA